MTTQQKLPRFGNPPVTETVLGLEFKPLEKWDVPYFGLYWQTIRAEFPEFEVKPPVVSQIERFDGGIEPTRNLRFLSHPEIRCWYIKADKRTLVQVQRDRFIVNWRKGSQSDQYPHYEETMRPFFQNELRRFKRFVEEYQLGEVGAIQCEVTYINHLEKGKEWDGASEIGRVFTSWANQFRTSFLPKPEDAEFGLRFALPNNIGRLHVSVQPAIRNSDKKEILQLTLTVRGKPADNNENAIMAFLDLGREWVVRGFAELTTPEMHKLWERSS